MQQWSVVVPAKRLTAAKTRLAPLTAALAGGSPAGHADLVLAPSAVTSAAARGSSVTTSTRPTAGL
ncbi:hypothetical protein M2C68_19980, partial [Pseudomonas sp. BAgro211]|nr:hypothetical protein [Pseudomonas sp. BAgro211]